MLEGLHRRFVDFELKRLDEMFDLRATRNILVGGPVKLLAAFPCLTICGLEGFRGRGENARDAVEAHPFVLARDVPAVRNQRFPQIEGDRFDHCNFTRPPNPSSYPWKYCNDSSGNCQQ